MATSKEFISSSSSSSDSSEDEKGATEEEVEQDQFKIPREEPPSIAEFKASSKLLWTHTATLLDGKRVFPLPVRLKKRQWHIRRRWRPTFGPEGHDFDAYKSARLDAAWRASALKAIKSHFGKASAISRIRMECMTGRAKGGENASNLGPYEYPEMLARRPIDAEEPPLSCGLRHVLDDDGQAYLAHAKGVGVYARPLDNLDDGQVKEVVNYYATPIEKVLGLESNANGSGLLALRYSQSVCLASLDGDIKHEWKRDGFTCLAANFLKYSDTLAVLDAGGSLVTYSLETFQTVGRKESLPSSRWAALGGSTSEAMVAAFRKTVKLIDMRSKTSSHTLFCPWDMGFLRSGGETAHAEIVAGVAVSIVRPDQVYCATNDRLILLDARMTGGAKPPINAWSLAIDTTPFACDVFKEQRGQSGEETVAVYNKEMEIELARVAADSSATLTSLPSPVETLTSLHGMTQAAWDYLNAPFTGLVVLNNRDGVSLVAANAVGVGLSCELTTKERNKGEDSKADGSEQAWRVFAEDVRQKANWAKKSLATTVTRREQQTSGRILANVVERPDWDLCRRRAKAKAPLKPLPEVSPYAACPWLKAFDREEHDDQPGYRMQKILKGEEGAFQEVAGTKDDPARFQPLDVIRKKTRRMRHPALYDGAVTPNLNSSSSEVVTSTQQDMHRSRSPSRSPSPFFSPIKLATQLNSTVTSSQQSDFNRKKRKRSMHAGF